MSDNLNVGEFHAMCDFVNPGVVGTVKTFMNVYDKIITSSREPNASADVIKLGKERIKELSEITQGFILRRTSDVNRKYIPPKSTALYCMCIINAKMNLFYLSNLVNDRLICIIRVWKNLDKNMRPLLRIPSRMFLVI